MVRRGHDVVDVEEYFGCVAAMCVESLGGTTRGGLSCSNKLPSNCSLGFGLRALKHLTALPSSQSRR